MQIPSSRLRSCRERRLITRAELAELSGVSLGTIERIEGGRSKQPQMRIIRQLAAALEVEVDEIVEWDHDSEAEAS